MAAVRHLGFVMARLDHPRPVLNIDGITVQNLAAINAVISMQVLIFNEFGLKMPNRAQNGAFWKILPHKLGVVTSRSPTGTVLCRNTS